MIYDLPFLYYLKKKKTSPQIHRIDWGLPEARGEGMDKGGQKIQTFTCKMSKSWGCKW